MDGLADRLKLKEDFMDKKEINIVYKSVDELIPYVNNPRDNAGAVDAVASSIKNFGFKVPIVIDKGNEIVTGHTRLLAAKKLGMERVPVIIADDLSEAKVKAFRLADNKVGELADWDWSLLDSEFEELKEMELDFDMEEFGFQDLASEDLEDDQMVSGELDISDFEDTLEVKLKFNYDDYHKVVSFLKEYDDDLSQALLKVMADND